MKWTPEEHEHAKALRDKGLTQAQIAEQLGRTVSSVREKLCRSRVYVKRGLAVQTDWDNERIRETPKMSAQFANLMNGARY